MFIEIFRVEMFERPTQAMSNDASSRARIARSGSTPARVRLRGNHTRRFVALSTLLLIAACSSIRLGYNNADTLLIYALDSYLDLDDQQSRLTKERLRKLVDWHRSTQLPSYAELFDDAQRRVSAHGTELSADDVLAYQQQLNTLLTTVGEQAAPGLAELAVTLTPAQVDRFAEKLASDTSKARREMIKIAGYETHEDRVLRYAERAQSWLGPLTKTQLEFVRASLTSRPETTERWMSERERRQDRLIAILRRVHAEHASARLATLWLQDYIAELAEPADPMRRSAVLAWRRANAELMAQLINSATAEQRATLGRRLRDYASDFSKLAIEASSHSRS